MNVDVIKAKQIPFLYVSPAVCDFIFSASGSTSLFLSRSPSAFGYINLIISEQGDGYRLQWDTYPGALCYSVYKLVDELDPFSGYRLIAECITDNFLDVTDPGAYSVTPVTPDGEGDIPSPVPTPSEPPDPCSGASTPTLIGKSMDVCPNEPTDISLTDLVVSDGAGGGAVTFSLGSVAGGSASINGATATFTPPGGGMTGNALVNIVVTNVCGLQSSTSVLLEPYELGTFNKPDTFEACQEVPITIDVADYIDVPAAPEQTFQVQSANVFDQGGSLVFGAGSVIEYTSNAASLGTGTITFCATDQCGREICGEFDILIVCNCTEAMQDVTTQSVTGGATGSWTQGYGVASINAVAVPFSGSVSSTTWTETVVTPCVAQITLSGGTGIFASLNVNGSNIWSSSTPGTYNVAFNTSIGFNSATITVSHNNFQGPCNCAVQLGSP